MYKTSRFLILLLSTCLVHASLLAQNNKPLPADYKFRLGITYEMTSGKPGETPRTTETTFWFSDKDYAGFEVPKRAGMFMIYDLPNKQMVTIMDDKKMVMVMDMGKMEQKMDSIHKKQAAAPAFNNDVKISKTGKSEKILGYSCDQYQITTTKANSLVWVTKELGTGIGNFAQGFSQLMKTNPSGGGMPDMKAIGNGVMLKMETTSTESGATSKMEAKSVNKEGKTIVTAGYKLMTMPGN